MDDYRSPIAARLTALAANATAKEEPTVLISERPLGGLFQIAGWGNAFGDDAAPALSALGFEGVGNYSATQTADNARAFRIAPDRLLVHLQDQPKLQDAIGRLAPERAPAIDLSHSRVLLRIEGSEAENLFRRLVSIDVSQTAFPKGHFRQTGLFSFGVLIHRDSHEVFDIYIPATWSAAAVDFIAACAEPFACTWHSQ